LLLLPLLIDEPPLEGREKAAAEAKPALSLLLPRGSSSASAAKTATVPRCGILAARCCEWGCAWNSGCVQRGGALFAVVRRTVAGGGGSSSSMLSTSIDASDRKSTRLNSSHFQGSRMPSSA
jgi:hypothetical protein